MSYIFMDESRCLGFDFEKPKTSQYKDIENQVDGRLNTEIVIDTPAHEKCLQTVDFASWSIFRRYEHNDEQYHDIIKDLIVEDKPLF
jgi:hypothetical protein